MIWAVCCTFCVWATTYQLLPEYAFIEIGQLFTNEGSKLVPHQQPMLPPVSQRREAILMGSLRDHKGVNSYSVETEILDWIAIVQAQIEPHDDAGTHFCETGVQVDPESMFKFRQTLRRNLVVSGCMAMPSILHNLMKSYIYRTTGCQKPKLQTIGIQCSMSYGHASVPVQDVSMQCSLSLLDSLEMLSSIGYFSIKTWHLRCWRRSRYFWVHTLSRRSLFYCK